MKLLDYYKELSHILEEYREERMNHKTATNRLNDINEASKNANLNVFTSTKVLQNIEIYDDERSYEAVSYDDTSYED